MKILMVCLGNICRSPLAEGILKSKVDSSKITVDSAGTSGFHSGSLPDSRSIEIAQKNGVDITDQRSRIFTVSDFDSFDIIYTMDASNYENVNRLARNESDKAKVKMILDKQDVPDPYYGGKQGFQKVYQMLEDVCETIASKLQSK